MRRKLTIEPSPLDKRDYLIESIIPGGGNLPELFDMRDSLKVVRDQGSEGTCAAFTASCIKEYQEYFDTNFTDYMSPRFIYSNRINQDSEGMYPRDVMKILHTVGSVPETTVPYDVTKFNIDEYLDIANKYKIKAYASIKTIDGLKQSLITNGPALLAVPVYNYGVHMWKQFNHESLKGGHAMTIVGWNNEGFIVRNSWGKKWQDNGYTIFPYEHWGMQWEVWSTVDVDNTDYNLPDNKGKKENKTIFELFSEIVIWLKSLFSN